jgi:hypothetical protein
MGGGGGLAGWEGENFAACALCKYVTYSYLGGGGRDEFLLKESTKVNVRKLSRRKSGAYCMRHIKHC